jgi:hypothetical protein
MFERNATSAPARVWLGIALLTGILGVATGASATSMSCDFEAGVYPACSSVGMTFGSVTGFGLFTNQQNHTPGGSLSLYNDANRKFDYSGPGVASLWIIAWASFPATEIFIDDLGGTPLLSFSLTTAWQQIALGGLSSFVLRPKYGGTNDFGTFAIDDINAVPEPTTALLLAGGLAGLAAAGRRRSLH